MKKEGQTSCWMFFCELLAMTRRRHQIPPQPKTWFKNLIQCFGGDLKIRVAFQKRRALAAILTLRFGEVLTYKYGGSDPQFHNLGGTHLLFWKAIQEGKGRVPRRSIWVGPIKRTLG